jgi:hypothetical protein
MSLANDLPRRIIEAVASHALRSGWFDKVNQFEPKSMPGNGITCSVWVQNAEPASSGLAATSIRFELSVRLYSAMIDEPQDMIDPNLTAAAWDLFVAYSSGFTLGGLVESIDLLGKDGSPLRWEAGYVQIEKPLYRIITITLPVKINDAFDQVP